MSMALLYKTDYIGSFSRVALKRRVRELSFKAQQNIGLEDRVIDVGHYYR